MSGTKHWRKKVSKIKALIGLLLVLALGWLSLAWAGDKPSSKYLLPPGQAVSEEEAAAASPTARSGEALKAKARLAQAAVKSKTKPAPEASKQETPPAPSQEGAGLAESDQPIRILSKRLEADDKALTVTFQGQVKATQGQTTLWCDRMVVHYTKEEQAPGSDQDEANRKIRKIEVFGHVKVIKQDKTALGQQGLYELESRRVQLWGKPRLIQGQNIIDGDRVILYLDQNRAVVEGGPEKVEAVLVPTRKQMPAVEPEPPKGKEKG